jgi:hypothetical protein
MAHCFPFFHLFTRGFSPVCSYETTRALPVEYGAVNTASAFSGLVFYREHRGMSGLQLGLTLAGVATILCGIGVGTLGSPQGAPSEPPAATAQMSANISPGRAKGALVVKAPSKSAVVISTAGPLST